MSKKKVDGYLIFAFGVIWFIFSTIGILASMGIRFETILGVAVLAIAPALICWGGWRMAHRKVKIDEDNDKEWYDKVMSKKK
jgi:succinate-acetate transporter protein